MPDISQAAQVHTRKMVLFKIHGAGLDLIISTYFDMGMFVVCTCIPK